MGRLTAAFSVETLSQPATKKAKQSSSALFMLAPVKEKTL
jgi:hypothetical protein